eukprot:GILI01023817.1.p1 GENE.GILI01023817.1~~GILI01023817.1.p1  ORF type:complete len:352 (-),score=49.50 GILI01023817.1:160-1149(-)
MSVECSGHGLWIAGKCECDVEYSYDQSKCSLSFEQVVGKDVWSSYVWVSTTMFTVAAICTVICLVKLILSFTAVHSRVPRKRSAVFILLLVACVLRMLFYGVDPYGYKGVFSRMVFQLIYGLPFPLIGSAYAFVLILWADAYNVYSGQQVPFLSRVPRLALFGVGLLFAVEILVRVLMGARVAEGTVHLIWQIYYGIFVSAVGIGYAVYGVRLHKWIRQSFIVSDKAISLLKKILYATIGCSVIPFIGVLVVLILLAVSDPLGGWHFLSSKMVLEVVQLACIANLLYAAHHGLDSSEIRRQHANEVTEQLLRDFVDDISLIPRKQSSFI